MKISLVCPKCKNKLKLEKRKYVCEKCKNKFNIIGGISSFITPDESIIEVEKKELSEIERRSQQFGWKNTIEKYIYDKFPELHRYISDPTRSGLVYLLSPKKFGTALDIGCGYGTISLALSEFFKNVVSEDISIKKLNILKERMKAENKRNITLINADALSLPLPENSFDAITVIGVLEYMGLSKKELLVEECWKMFLNSVYNMLKEGGQAIFGIENRIGFQYFLGWKDHNGLRATTLMPRFLANIYSKLKLNEEYKVYTYSYSGYKKMLKDVGFKKIEFFSPLKSYRFPKYIIPLDNGKPVWNYFLKNMLIPKSKKERILVSLAKNVPISIIKMFSPHFIIKVEK